MTSDPNPTVRKEAIAWHIRLRDGQAEDWDKFEDWLASDPSHASAYDKVALGDQDIDGALTAWSSKVAVQTNDNLPLRSPTNSNRRWLFGGVGAAAAAAALFLAVQVGVPGSDPYEVSTRPGEQRIVTLGRDQIALNGDTRIELDRKNPRFASLASGEAAFSIVHDPKIPFTLQLGNDRLVDVGTSFNVVRTPAGHRIEVAAGSILYNPERERIALAAGQSLTSRTSERRIILSRKPVEEVGGWQRGHLSYRATPLADVAADIARNLGTKVTVDPVIAGRSFTGTIEIDRNESRMFARLSRLLDVDARNGPAGWKLVPAEAAVH